MAAAVVVAVALGAAGLRSGLRATEERGEAVGADGPAYVRIARTLLASGSLVLPGPGRIDADSQQRPHTVYGTPWSLGSDGRLYPKHSWLFAALLVPGVALGGARGAVAEAVLLGAALSGFLAWRASRAFGPLPAAAAALAILLAEPGGRNVLFSINIDVALAFLFLASLAAAADGHPLAAGLLAGLSPLLRPTAPLLFLALPFALREGSKKSWLRLAAGLLPGLLLFAAANTAMFGAPWATAYQRAAVWDGSALHVASVARSFGADLLPGLRILLLHPEGGLLPMFPAALLALAGFLRPEVRSAERLGGAFAALASYLALAGYGFLREVPETSYRFAFPFVAASVAPLAGLLAAAGAARARSRP